MPVSSHCLKCIKHKSAPAHYQQLLDSSLSMQRTGCRQLNTLFLSSHSRHLDCRLIGIDRLECNGLFIHLCNLHLHMLTIILVEVASLNYYKIF